MQDHILAEAVDSDERELTSREHVEWLINPCLSEIAGSVGLPISKEDAEAVVLTAQTLRALLASCERYELLLRNPVRSDDGFYDYLQHDVDAALARGDT